MRTYVLIALALSFGLSLSQTMAQDQPIQIIRGKKLEVEAVAQQLELNRLQIVDAQYGWSASSWYGAGNAELIDYLSSPSVRKQLELTDAQTKEFQQLQKDYRKEYGQLYSKFPELRDKNLPNEARKELNRKVRLAGNKLRKEFSDKVKESLIPQQVSMVKTLKFKQMKQRFGMAHALTNGPAQDELNVTDEQKKDIQKIQKESQEAIQKKIKELKAAAEKEMLKVLDAKQRKALKGIEGTEK